MANYYRPIIKVYPKSSSPELRTPNSELCSSDLKRVIPNWKLLGLFMVLLCLTACATSIETKEQALVHMRMGDSLLQERRPTQALSELIKAVDLDPNNPLIRNMLGVAYLEKGMFGPATIQFQKALTLDPGYMEVHNNLGSALLKNGRVEESIKEFNLALNHPLYSTPHFALFNLGQAYSALKEYGNAQEYYREAIEISPGYSLAYHGLGLALKATKQPVEASEALKKAIEHAPTFSQAHFDLGEVLLELNQPSLARLAFLEVIRLGPDSALGKKAQKRLKELQ
jgi:type IV pilus assembly protein PilF